MGCQGANGQRIETDEQIGINDEAMLEALSKVELNVERLMAFVGMEQEIKPKKKEKQRGYDNESED